MSFSIADTCGFPYEVTLSDLESMVTDNKFMTDGNNTFQYGHRLGTFANSDIFKLMADKTLEVAAHYSGYGGFNNSLQNFLSRIDRFGTAIVPTNSMYRGYTFITRPRLNLTGANLHANSLMTTLHNSNEKSVSFMIRALLDTRLSRGDRLYITSLTPEQTITPEIEEFKEAAEKSPLFDIHNPFFTPLINGLTAISGFPDFTLETDVFAGDFHGGDFTFAKGSDMMNRTQELSLSFRDVGGSIILSCFYYWVTAIALLTKGVMVAYPDDIYERRLNYTVSIYRFITDMSGRQVQWWAKATGCFPKSVPVGALFNISQEEVALSSARNFTIPFVANDVKVNDPGALFDFNILMRRYQPDITNGERFVSVTDHTAEHNFNCLPYLTTDAIEGITLDWRTSVDYLSSDYSIQNGKVVFDPDTLITPLVQDINTIQSIEINKALEQVGIDPTKDAINYPIA